MRGAPGAAFAMVFLLAALAAPAHGFDINCSQGLTFGTIVACNGQDGTITLSPAGQISSTPSCLSVLGGALPGQCIINDPDQNGAFNISMSPATTLEGGAHSLLLNDLMLETADEGPDFILSLNPVGPVAVNIGGTLAVPAGITGGTYDGAILVTVAYE